MKKLLLLFTVQKLILVFVMMSMLLQQHRAYSQALPVAPVANFVMNRAVGGVLTRVAIARGFAANDPRIAATLLGASTSLTAVNVASTVAGVALAVAGAPVWLTVVAGLGVFAIGAAIVAGTSSISLKAGSISIGSPSGISAPSYSAPSLVANDRYADFSAMGLRVYRDAACLPSQFCYAYAPLPSGTLPYKWNPNVGDNTQGQAYVVFFSLQELRTSFPINKHKAGQAWTQVLQDSNQSIVWNWTTQPDFEYSDNGTVRLVGATNMTFTCNSGSCNSLSIPANWDSNTAAIEIGSSEGVRPYKSLDTAYPNISPSTKSQPLSADTVARIADQAWKNAASQPGYQGLPYSVAQPVTAADVSVWQAENPASMPTIGDLLAPANNPGANTVPISPNVTVNNPNPSPSPNPNPTPDPNAIYNVNIVNAPRVDLGADPKIAAPTLETTPTAWEILAPIMTLFPELKSYQAPQHVGECPKPNFQLFGKSIVMDTHCIIAEQNRQTIGAVMVTVWVLVGLFILLSA